MGPELCQGLRDHLGDLPVANSNASETSFPINGSRGSHRRKRDPAAEKGDIADTCAYERDNKRTRLCLAAICRPEERRRHQAGGEPEDSELLCSTGVLQDGRFTPYERPLSPRRLDDKGRSEGCVLRNLSTQPLQETSKIPLAREGVPVQLPTIRAVVGPAGLYQYHKASSDCSQNTGHENNHLHRRHPGDGNATSREAALEQTECLIFLPENLGFTIN